MKRLTIILLYFVIAVVANANTDGIIVTWLDRQETSEINSEDPQAPHKLPPGICICELSQSDGIVSLDSGCTLEQEIGRIDLYEICDLNGETLDAFYDEDSFLRALFSLEGSYIIRFTNKDYILTGSVEL